MTTAILLRGHLGAKFGPRFDLSVASPAQAIKALCHRVKGFRQYLEESKGGFKILVADQPIDQNQLGSPTGHRSIRIIPVVSGADGDVGRVILGVALVAFSIWNPLGWAAIGSKGALGLAMAQGVGMSLALGGVVGLLTSAPRAPGADGTTTDQSYLFSGGGANPTGQGGRVPVLLGRMEIAGVRISGGIDPESGYSPTELGSSGEGDGVWTNDGHGGHTATKRSS